MGERVIVLSTSNWPRSMRLAMATSPSRVSRVHGAHFAQIHANRVIRLFEHPRRKVEFALFGYRKVILGFNFRGFGYGRIGGGASGLRRGLVFVNIDSVAFKRGKQVVDFFRGVYFGRQGVVYFVVEQVPALFTQGDELPYLIVFFFNSQRQGNLPKSNARTIRMRTTAPAPQITMLSANSLQKPEGHTVSQLVPKCNPLVRVAMAFALDAIGTACFQCDAIRRASVTFTCPSKRQQL